jgi:hypothetical protein
MQGWLRRGWISAARMSCDKNERRYVRTGTVLGGALQGSPGPEATAIQRTLQETLGWDDGLNLSTPRHGRPGQRS